MARRNLLTLSLLVSLGLGVPYDSVMGQQKPLKQQLVGTWTYVSSTARLPDGSPQWGTNPKSMLIFTENGHFAWHVFRSDRPRFTSNDRTNGTPEEIRATMQGSLAYFGTYSVDERNKTLTTRIEGSTFPNSEGEVQTRMITRLTADELIYTNLETTLGLRVEAAWRRVH